MRDFPNRFILYRREWDATKGKWQKIPCDQHGATINPHLPSVWMDHATASRHATWDETRPKAPYGIGFVLNGDGWFLIDLDACKTDEGSWEPKTEALFLSFSGALGEISTSGNGLHILGRCDPSKLADRRNKWEGDKEFYTDKRFVALSKIGPQPIHGTATDKDWTDQLLKVVPQREFLGELPDGVDPTYTGPTDDDALIQAMLRSKNTASQFGEGVSVADLWEARTEPLSRRYPAYDGKGGFDHSSADAALMLHLAFWTGKNMPRMDRLFRRSKLTRDKYKKRAGYRRDTIQNAARLCKAVYSVKTKEEPADRVNVEWEPLPSAFMQPEMHDPPKLELSPFLPPDLAQWVKDAAKAKSAPPDYVFFAFLSVSASLIGNARRVSPRPSWSQALAVWPMCIGNPSASKSPALDAVIDPLREIERPFRKLAETAYVEWKTSNALADLAESEWNKTVKKAFSRGETPPEMPSAMKREPEPHIPRLMITDCTIEKLAMICANQPKGVLQFRDELSGWLQGMTRYSNSSDRPFWLEANGGRSFTIDRVGRDPVTIPHLLITVLGGIQPDKLKSHLITGDDDGLLARFIPVWPEPVPLDDHSDHYSDESARQVFIQLHALEMACDKNGDAMPIIIAFDKPARAVFHKFRLRLREQETETSGHMIHFLGKLAGLTATLALLRAYLAWAQDGAESEPSQIGIDDITKAIALAENYIIPMAQRTYSAFGARKEIVEAIGLLAIIKSHGWNEFTQRQLQRTLGNRISGVRDLEAQLRELISVDAIRLLQADNSPKGGRPTKRFIVNPFIYRTN